MWGWKCWKPQLASSNGAGAYFPSAEQCLNSSFPPSTSPKHFLIVFEDCVSTGPGQGTREATDALGLPSWRKLLGTQKDCPNPTWDKKKSSQKEPISDVMNMNKKPLLIFMAGPWGWGLEMRLKRPCSSFQESCDPLGPRLEEVGSYSGPSDSSCLHLCHV